MIRKTWSKRGTAGAVAAVAVVMAGEAVRIVSAVPANSARPAAILTRRRMTGFKRAELNIA
jgi:hypothetical protein